MAINVNWDNVPSQLLQIIGGKICSANDFIRFSAVSKTWQSVMSERREAEKALMMVSPESPLLLLAEEVQRGLLSCDINSDEDENGYEEENVDEEMEESEEGEEESEDEDDDEDDFGDEGEEVDEFIDDEDIEINEEGRADQEMEVGQDEGFEDIWNDRYQYMKRYYRTSVFTARGIYSLSTEKLYTIELPEAAGKLVLGTKKGWMLTLGKSFETSLLHPLLRQEVSLPSMRVVRVGNEDITYKGVFLNYIRKASMCSGVQPNENVLFNDRPDPIIMIIYGEQGYLAFARPGDEVWTKVDVPWEGAYTDIAYHRGKFYSVNCKGSTFVCHVIDYYTNGRQATGKKVADCPVTEPVDNDFVEKYLVESGCHLWLLLRLRTIKLSDLRLRYGTTRFLVWKLEEDVSQNGLETRNTWIQMNNLDNKAFFIGRNSSVSLPSSGCISPNCIYFTDDARELYFPDGGGHDMGVFNVESGTIVPHFEGKSLHPFSPPLWCI
ncbi:hypothetical protein AgCh_029531 [Apium graveolens]